MAHRRKPQRRTPPPKRRPAGPGRTIGVLVALLAALAAGMGVQAVRSGGDGPAWAPRDTVGRFGLASGSPNAAVTVDIYLDYLCPACRQFEQANAELLDQLTHDGQIRVVYHPMAILDRYSTTQYSSRAANAVGCAADTGSFVALQKQLFEHQPPEGGPGLPDESLIELGRRAGIADDAFGACVRDQSHAEWVVKATDVASQDNIFRTPTVKVNGVELSVPSTEELTAALEKAGVS